MTNTSKLLLLVSLFGFAGLLDELTKKEPKQVKQLGEHQQAHTSHKWVKAYSHKSVVVLDEMGE